MIINQLKSIYDNDRDMATPGPVLTTITTKLT